MKVGVTGSSGFIGRALVRDLRDDGHTVLRLVRREPSGPDEVRWDPYGDLDSAARAGLEGVDAVVHLAGPGIGDRRWTASYQRKLRDARIVGTSNLTGALARLDAKPRVLISASGMNYYGDTGDRETYESDPPGTGFLAELAQDWETAAAPAVEAGIRVVHPRSCHVLAGDGGLLGRLIPLFRLGLGGKLGNGRQWMSWISRDDHIAALQFVIDRDDISGPVNFAAPQPVTNAEFTKALGRALHRPTPFSVPPFALRIALDGLADEGVLIDLRILPGRLTEAGFPFRHPDLDTALRAVLPGR
jgi:uncharacterized protein (TIGR01777 family)